MNTGYQHTIYFIKKVESWLVINTFLTPSGMNDADLYVLPSQRHDPNPLKKKSFHQHLSFTPKQQDNVLTRPGACR